jgi:hypothetical protein
MKINFLRLFLLTLLAPLFLTEAAAQIVINEYSCANWKQFADSYLEYEDWVELYNSSATETVDLAGYYMSDDDDKPEKWKIPTNAASVLPPGGFLRIWCSGRDIVAAGSIHAGFRLTQTRNKAEHIVLANPSGTVLQDIKVKKTAVSQSRCRATDGGTAWRICTAPSPGLTNNGTAQFTAFADRPDFSQEAGFYQDSVTVSISSNEPGGSTYYTTDGSEPTTTSSVYSAPIQVTQTTVLKAVTYSSSPDVLPSFVQYGTYFIGANHTLVVVSVGAKEVLNLANGNQSLRPTGSIEYFGLDKTRKARSYGELNSHGQDSWVNDQRGLDWVSRDEFGYSYAVKEKIFSRSDRDEYQRIILRASGDDNFPDGSNTDGAAHVRDAYIHNLADRGGLHLDLRRSEKAIVYLNGKYWGVYDLRELPDDHDYTDYYYGQGKYEIQYLLTWGNTWAEYGGSQALTNYNSLYNFIQNNSMADPAKYAYVDERYDVTSLADYVIANSMTVCSDWLNYNTGWWRGLNPEGGHQKWGYILWDNDATFGHYINYTGIPNTSPSAAPCDPETLQGSSDPKGHIKVLKKLRQNPTFNQYYITRQADLMQTVFGCDNMLSYLDSIVNTIQPEMQQHCARWNGSYNLWLSNVEVMRQFIIDRCALLPDGLSDCYDLNGPYQTVVMSDPPGVANFKINTLEYNSAPVTNVYFGGIGTKLGIIQDSASASTYVFDRWSSAVQHTFSDSLSATTLVNLTQPDTIVAHFKKVSSGISTVVIDRPSMIAYPTVFDQSFTVECLLPQAMETEIKLFDLYGRELATIQPATRLQAGSQVIPVQLAGAGIADGVYVLQLRAGSQKQSIKVIKAR